MNCLKPLLVFLLFIPFSLQAVFAQPSVHDQKGAELLQKASEKMKGYASFEIDFSYVLENEEHSMKETMDGRLLSQGDKYVMKVGENTFISDGINVWTYLEEFNEVHISLAEETEGGMTPTSLFDEFETQFRSRFIRREQLEGKPVDIIDLVPHQPQAFFKYRVALDGNDQSLVYTEAYDRQGGTYTYTVKRLRTNVTVPSDAFTFSPSNYPGIEIIDLR